MSNTNSVYSGHSSRWPAACRASTSDIATAFSRIFSFGPLIPNLNFPALRALENNIWDPHVLFRHNGVDVGITEMCLSRVCNDSDEAFKHTHSTHGPTMSTLHKRYTNCRFAIWMFCVSVASCAQPRKCYPGIPQIATSENIRAKIVVIDASVLASTQAANSLANILFLSITRIYQFSTDNATTFDVLCTLAKQHRLPNTDAR